MYGDFSFGFNCEEVGTPSIPLSLWLKVVVGKLWPVCMAWEVRMVFTFFYSVGKQPPPHKIN